MPSRGPGSPHLSGDRQDQRSTVLPAPRSTADSGTVAALSGRVPPLRLRTMTRLARLRMGIAKAVARACSVLQFHAIKTFVPI